ncbi:MAG: DUF6090 family protein [Balneolaceae bacterium]|nr:DUF6090 family protein [Balneolaceae bacterium]
MITLFRRIREKLIASGSLTKYLLYAIGEILLVVIGILIALQVNNWNEERKAKNDEEALLQNVMSTIYADSLNFENSILTLDQVNTVHENLVRIQKSELSPDSLRNTYLLRRSILFEPVSNRDYPDLPNQVIEPEVRQAVLDYYQSLRRWQFIIDNYNDFIENQMRPQLGNWQLLNFGYGFVEEEDEANNLINDKRLIQLLDNTDFQQLLFEAAVKTRNLRGILPYIVEQRENLKTEITKVLDR